MHSRKHNKVYTIHLVDLAGYDSGLLCFINTDCLNSLLICYINQTQDNRNIKFHALRTCPVAVANAKDDLLLKMTISNVSRYSGYI